MKTLKELLRKEVGRKQPVVFAFGRLNPPTVGHQKLIDKVITMAKRVKGLPVLYVSASQDKNKNPLTAKQKLDYLENYQSKSIVSNPKFGELDVITITRHEKKAFVNFLNLKKRDVIILHQSLNLFT